MRRNNSIADCGFRNEKNKLRIINANLKSTIRIPHCEFPNEKLPLLHYSKNKKEVRLMAEIKVGVVKNYFAKPSVAAIEVTEGEFQVGDVIWFKGHTTDFQQEVISIQEEKETISKAAKGQLVGVQVKERVRTNDLVYKVAD
jgi:translation elongation factor EF-1alpha